MLCAMQLSFIVALQLAAGVMSHGYVKYHILNTKTYTGFLPLATPNFTLDAPSIVRKVGGLGPVLDILTPNITCNIGAVPINDSGISRVGEVAAGSNATFIWNTWPHSGPILTYMAKCEPDCGNFTGSEGKNWFKIDEVGYNGTSGAWATYYLVKNANTWVVTIPPCLTPGEYLIRHEIIALSECKTAGRCQFYPSCAQVKVTGEGSYVFGDDELVAFPGAYTTEGVMWDTNTGDPKLYQIPGPAVFTCPS